MRPADIDQRILAGEPCYIGNSSALDTATAFCLLPSQPEILEKAVDDWSGFAVLLARLFPELEQTNGRVDSPLVSFESEAFAGLSVVVKSDHLLPVTGTIKARGGVFEVLSHARDLAAKQGLVAPDAPADALLAPRLREFFSSRSIVTGSTGNLGYSVGLAATALGFRAEVHMSADAKAWKIERLRKLGALVHTHTGDFSAAVSLARKSAQNDDQAYFVDDEDSFTLFQGYAAAAHDLKAQLDQSGIAVSADAPLAVYLPCGVGGAAGGVTFGLKTIYGDDVHCVIVEPVASPSVMLQSLAGTERRVSSYDYGLDNITIADGLAVPSASLLAVSYIQKLAAGFATVADHQLLEWVGSLWREQSMRLEPSAAAGFSALKNLSEQAVRPQWFEKATHVVWTTGGSQLPDHEFQQLLGEGQ